MQNLVRVQFNGDFLDIMQEGKLLYKVKRVVLARVVFFQGQHSLGGWLYRARWLRALETQLEMGPDECMDNEQIRWDGQVWVRNCGTPIDYASFVDIDLREQNEQCPVLAIRRPEESFDHMPLLEIDG